MNRKRTFISLLLICLLPMLSVGRNFSFSKISVEDGLSNNQVNVIFKDSYGFMWFGTVNGLDRYDGVEVRSYSERFPETVNNIHAIAEDSKQQLWIGTESGLFYRSSLHDRFEKVSLGLNGVAVKCLLFVSDFGLCVGTTAGLFIVDTRTKQAEHILFNDVVTEKVNHVAAIYTDGQGICWLATHNGLVRYSLRDLKKEYFQCSLFPLDAYNSLTSICSIGDKIYLGTSYMGLLEFDLSTKTFAQSVGVDNKMILTMATDAKENLFVGTDGGGLKVVNVKNREVVDIVSQESNPASLSSNSVYSFSLDESGRYWIGTYSGGVNYTTSFRNIFKIHPVTSSYSDVNKSVRSFYFSPDGTQYIGTRNGLIRLTKGGHTESFQIDSENEKGLRSNIILSLYPYNGDILIGTYGGGISVLSSGDKKIKPFLCNSIFEKGNTYAFETDNKRNLWIATYSGIYRYSPVSKSFINYNKQNSGLAADEVFDLLFDSKGRLWVGTMSGISVFSVNGDRVVKLKIPAEAETNSKVNYIYEDRQGSIWLCTEQEGLAEFNQSLSEVKFLKEADGLPDNSVCAIVEGNTDEYWVSTQKGFCKYTGRNKRFTRYSLSDGLPGLVFSPAASFQSSDGNLYFGNEKGLVYFNPENIGQSSKSDKVCITDLYVEGKAVAPGEGSVLEQPAEATTAVELADTKSIGFRYVNLNFANSAENTYEYRLNGFDKDWINNGIHNTVFYKNIKPGSYVFEVRNANESDDVKANVAAVRIDVKRSLFNSSIFIVFVSLMVAILGFALIRFFIGLRKNGGLAVLSPASIKVEKYKSCKISEYHSAVLISEIIRVMDTQKPYLNAEFKLGDLATEIKFPLHEISQVLNQMLNQSFPDFVNKYRVEEVKKRLKDKAYDRFTFFAIAQQCGFNSKTSFYRTFKHETGKTPADYVKDLHE